MLRWAVPVLLLGVAGMAAWVALRPAAPAGGDDDTGMGREERIELMETIGYVQQ